VTSYGALLDVFFGGYIDPTTRDRQKRDRGTQARSAAAHGRATAALTHAAPLQLLRCRINPALSCQTLSLHPARTNLHTPAQYRSGIYVHSEAQRAAAEAKVAEVNARLRRGELGGVGWEGDAVVAPIRAAGDYYLAEAYHQDYLARGGRFGMAQSAAKMCTDPIRCYG